MTSQYRIRRAMGTDVEALVAFTLQEAREAEQLDLDPHSTRRGVSCAFAEPTVAAYWVVEDSNSELVASTSVVSEWSNFHGANYWWIQSLFVRSEHRGSGLTDLLLNHLAAEANAAGALDLRLYAHTSNQRALHAYRRCGFSEAPYLIMRREIQSKEPLPPPIGRDRTA